MSESTFSVRDPLLLQDAATPPHLTEALRTADRIPGFGTDIPATLNWCVTVGHDAPSVGSASAQLWELLAATAARSVAAARMLEPHLDALTILSAAGVDAAEVGADASSTWGVFAAEGPDMRVEAHRGAVDWSITGTKPWCSLAGRLSHALVTAHIGDERGLFAVDLRGSRVAARSGPWVARGLPDIVSAPVDFAAVPAVPVGGPGWYLSRRGFAWGGMSVAACWYGAASRLIPALAAAANSSRADQLALAHLGRADAALWSARAVLRDAADTIDHDPEGDARLLAERVRGIVADAATAVLREVDLALGPARLVSDEAYARRVADLHLYLRQHHGLRDAARLGRLVTETQGSAR